MHVKIKIYLFVNVWNKKYKNAVKFDFFQYIDLYFLLFMSFYCIIKGF